MKETSRQQLAFTRRNLHVLEGIATSMDGKEDNTARQRRALALVNDCLANLNNILREETTEE